MSVLVSDRTESKFEAITYSIELHDMLIDFMQRSFGVKDLDQLVRVRYAHGKDAKEDFSRYRYLMLNYKNRIDQLYTIPQGHHDGSGKVGISAAEKEKIIPDNIREGITLLGVEGSMSGTEDAKPQAKTVTPSTKEQTVLPNSEEGYNYLSQVTVKAIPYNESENPAGGTTVTIG